MLFAEYPFKGILIFYSGHDMKAEINRRCNPQFSLSNTLTKKERLKDLPSDVEDFFKKIFVLDSKKRLTFSAILKHPLLKDYEK
jgi:serine/threonine protein kinase